MNAGIIWEQLSPIEWKLKDTQFELVIKVFREPDMFLISEAEKVFYKEKEQAIKERYAKFATEKEAGRAYTTSVQQRSSC